MFHAIFMSQNFRPAELYSFFVVASVGGFEVGERNLMTEFQKGYFTLELRLQTHT